MRDPMGESVTAFKFHGEALSRELHRALARGAQLHRLEHAHEAQEVIARADAVFRNISLAVQTGNGMLTYAGRFIDSPVQRVMEVLGISNLAGIIAYDAVIGLLNRYLDQLVRDVAAVNVLIDELEEQNE